MPEVKLENVSRSFGAVAAVRDISLTVPDLAFVTLLGPSGCGKTTTLRMIAGLEQNNDGQIAIGDRMVSDARRGRFVPPEQRNAGMVFQSYAIWPHMTVFDNVAYPLRIRRLRNDIVREKTMKALRMVEMGDYVDRAATALSGGQQQRVAIARAIAFEPSVLLLDEPLSNLDAKLREQMRIELRMLQRRLGITTIYVTHDQEEAMALSDLIVVMDGGRILQIGAPETVYFKPATRKVAAFCGSPNILSGNVVEARRDASGVTLVKICGAGWEGWAQSDATLVTGQRVIVVVRPEAVEVVPNGANGSDFPSLQWSGEVMQDIFRGFRRTLIVRSGEAELTVDSAGDRATPAGTKVTLRIAAHRTWVLPDDKTSGTESRAQTTKLQ